MFLKMYLTPRQLASLHNFLDGDALYTELSQLLGNIPVEENEERLQEVKEQLIQLKVSDFSPPHKTYKVEVEIQEVLKFRNSGYLFVPMSIMRLLLTALLLFPETAQAIDGNYDPNDHVSSATRLHVGSVVSVWDAGLVTGLTWDHVNKYNVSRLEGDRVYLLEAEYAVPPESVRYYHCGGNYDGRRAQALKELQRRGVDYFSRAEFKVHLIAY